MSDQHIQYPDEFTGRLETVWGEGFLSPGGPEEVREILNGVNLVNGSVLDIGFGTGGAEIVMAKDLGAIRVVGIDVEPQLVDKARKLIERHGLTDRVELQLVEPGPLNFPDNEFDCVFSKDSLIHVGDKESMFIEILRVLKPGGVFAGSDWLIGENMEDCPEWKEYYELSHLEFRLATAQETVALISECGFENASYVDRNQWYSPICAEEVKQIEGPLRDTLLKIVDEEVYLHWCRIRRALSNATRVGALRPTHLRGYKAS